MGLSVTRISCLVRTYTGSKRPLESPSAPGKRGLLLVAQWSRALPRFNHLHRQAATLWAFL